MNIFKINSQGLIKSQVDEDVFNSIIGGEEDHVFSMQRFADYSGTTLFRQATSAGKTETTVISSGTSANFFTPYTLGRSTDSTATTANTTTLGTDIVVAPMVSRSSTSKTAESGIWSSVWTADSDTALGGWVIQNSSYQVKGYTVDGSNTRLAIEYTAANGVPLHTNGNGEEGYWVGVAYASGTGITAKPADTDATFTPADYSGTSYSTVYTAASNTNYVSVYKGIGYGDTYSTRLGATFPGLLTSGTGKTYSLDYYDVKVLQTDVYKDGAAYYFQTSDTTKGQYFKAEHAIKFDGVDASETETYKINGVDVKVIGGEKKTSDTSLISMTVGQYQTSTSTAQTYSFTGITSDVSVQFSVYGGTASDVGVSLNGSLYKNAGTGENAGTGTVMFGATDTTPFITLGKGNFALAATDGTLYNLENNASATLAFAANKTYLIDLDGTGEDFAPMNIVTSKAGSATFVSGSSNVALYSDLAGTLAFSDAGTVSINFNGTDATKQLTFTGSSDASIGFAYNSTNVTLGGTFSSVASGTSTVDKPLYGFGFTLSDTSYAKLDSIAVSDTANSDTSYIAFGSGATSDTATVGGALSIDSTVNAIKDITFNMSDNAVVGVGVLTFSDTVTGDSSFKFTADKAISLSGALTVASGTSTTDVLTGYAFTISDTGFAQLGAVAVTDTKNGSATYIAFADSNVTLAGGNAAINFGKVGGSDVYTSYTYTLSDTGIYSINGTSFSANAAGVGTSNTVTFTGGDLTYSASHSDTAFAVVDTDAVTGFTLGANISASGTQVVPVGSATLVGTTYIGASTAAVSYTMTTDGTLSITAGDGFQVSAIDDTKNLVGLSSETIISSVAGTYFLADGGSDVTLKLTANSGALTFSEVSDGTVTKLVRNGAAVTVYGDAVLTAGTDVLTAYTLTSVGSNTSAITINGIKFEGSEATITNAASKATYTLNTTDTLMISADALSGASSFTWSTGSKGNLQLGAITFGIESDAGFNTAITIGVGSDVKKIDANSDTVSHYTFQRGTNGPVQEIQIADGSNGSDAYKVVISNTSYINRIEGISDGAVLTKVGGTTYVLTDSSGTFKFASSIETDTTSKKTVVQTFKIVGDTDVTFVMATDDAMAGTVVQITGLDEGATVYVSDTKSSATYSVEKQISGTLSRNTNGTWGTNDYMGYIVNQNSSYTLTGITSDADMVPVTTKFAADTITTDGTKVTVVSSDIALLPLTFKNTGDGKYAAGISDTNSTSLFTELRTTSNKLGVQANNDGSGNYALSLVNITGTGIPGSFTSKAALSDATLASVTLGDKAGLTVYTGFEVSGTGVSVTANSDTITVAAGASDVYLNMTDVSDTVVFGGENDDYKTFQIHKAGELTHTLKINTNSTSGKASGSNTEVFALTLANGAAVQDTISAGNDLAVNGITYSVTEGAGTYSLESKASDKDTLTITGGILTAASGTATDVTFLSNTNIVFAGASGVGLTVSDFTYQTMSDASAADTANFNIEAASNTQKVTGLSGGLKVQETVQKDKAFFFNGNLYTATSTVASIVLEYSQNDKFLEDTTAIGITAGTDSYVVAALSDTYTMSSGASVTLAYDATVTDTFANTTFTSGSGTFAGTATFHIAGNYLGNGGTDTTIYEYKASDASKLKTMTLNITAAGSETIALGSVVATRSADSTTKTFSFAPYGDKKLYQYNTLTGSTDTLTFSLDSDTAQTYGAEGVLTAGTGYRALGADETANSSTAVEYLGNKYLADEGSTMTLKIDASVGTETFTAGTGTFTADSGTTFYYDFLDKDGNLGTDGTVETLTAVSDVTMKANFEDGKGKEIVSVSGTATMEGAGTYVLEALSETYTIDSGKWTVELKGVGSDTMTLSSGSGTTTALDTFTLSDKYLNVGDKTDDIYTYTGNATLGMTMTNGSGTEVVSITSGSGTRVNDSATGVEFAYTLDGTSHTYTSTAANLSYKIDADIASTTGAAGSVFAGEGTRAFVAGSETSTLGNVEFLSDTYTVDGGMIQLTLTDGEGTETLISADATFTTSNTGVFHYVYGEATNTYTATADVTFKLTQGDTGTKLTSASGKGVRDLASGQSATFDYLGSNTYTFGSGTTVQVDITDVASATESAYAGTGTYTPATGDTAVAQFDASGSATGTAYSYTSFADATFQITMVDGAVTGQTLTAGSATRISESGEDFVYNTQSYTSKGDSMTFVLSADNASTAGAAGGIFSGIGYRTDTGVQSYTVSETQNAYTAVTNAEMQLTLTDGVGSETMFNATAEQGFDTFNYKGTSYKSSGTAVVGLKLELKDGVASETGISGTGIFESTAGTETFTYESNEYTADSGTQLSITFDGQADATPNFVQGSGHRELANGEEFTYTDKNVYSVTENGELSVKRETPEDSVTTLFSSGKGKLDSSKTDGQFYFTLDGEEHLYSDTGNAQVEITGSETGATVAFIGGTAERTDTTTNLEFTFNDNTYNLTSDSALTWTLGLDDSGTAVEKATGGKGTRTATDSFTYLSPVSQQTETYTTSDVVLSVEIKGEDGTETFVSGTGTRSIASDTFKYAAADLGGETATFTGNATYNLTLKQSQSENGGMLSLLDYNVDVVTETLTQATGTTEKTGEFAYKTIVTGETNTYTAEGSVTFELNLTSEGETVTWQSGTATMSLEDGTAFNYQASNADNAATYTVKSSATFNRENDTETFVSGDAFRFAADGENFTVDFNSDTYNAAASSTIVLKVAETGTAVNETFDAGTATYTADINATFHYTVGDATRAYTATDLTTLQVGVENGVASGIISATGAGTRGFEDGESTTYVVLDADSYTMTSGVFTLAFESGTTVGAETLTEGTGTYTAAVGGTFTVNDAVLGTGTETQVYTYNALSETKLNLTLKDGAESVAIEDGFGTRADDAGTFTFKGNAYTATGGLEYSINNTATVASGELYTAVGTRSADDATGTTVFNEDTYTVDDGILTLTVTEGVGDEKMTAGTATYKAAVGDDFHFSTDAASHTYKAIAESTLQITTNESGTNLFAINAQGTRAAEDADSNLSTTYLGDTYYATSGTTIQFTATGEVSSASETVYSDSGVVAMDVAATGTFHRATVVSGDEGETSDEILTYTAGSDVTISLSLSDSVRTFGANPYATRDALSTEESFTWKSQAYSADGGTMKYMLTGEGAESNLTESLYAATGTRENGAGDQYVSTLGNTYTLTSGTYGLTVTSGEGDETLLSGQGTATYTSGTFNYSAGTQYDEETGEDINLTTTYTAQSAVMSVTHDDSGEADTEVLTSGAGYDSANGRYILATNSTLDASATAGTAPVSVTANTSVVTLAADSTNGFTALESGELNATVTSSNTLKVNGKTYSAADNGVVTFNTALTSATAGNGTVTAEGDFTSSVPSLAGGVIGVAGDTDVAVVFADSITTLEKLSDDVQVNSAAGATRAITDSTGTFKFNNTAEQSFNVSDDASVTFQLDSDGVVTGIAGIDASSSAPVTIIVTDSGVTDTLVIAETGRVLTRDSETNRWTETAVEAVSYIVEVESDSSIAYSAVDVHGDRTKVNASVVGSADGTTITLNEGLTATTPVIITNASTDTVNLPGYVTGIGLTDGAAIQLDSDTATEGAFKTGTLSGTSFTANGQQTITGATFDVTSAGEILVNSQGDAKVAISDTSRVSLLADTNTDKFTINDGPEMTLAIGAGDTNGVGTYTLQSSGTTISGLTPSDVDTGTVVIPTDADGTTFAINSDNVSVTGDGDGMTLEIATDALVGLSGIDTNATVAASVSGDTLSVNGDAVTLTSDPIKYNATNEKWLSGAAPAAEGVIGYLIEVTSDNTVALSYQTSDTIKATTNVADYNAVFTDSGYAPDEDGGALKPYTGGEIVLNTLGSEVAVSVAAANGNVAVNVADSAGKDLILTSANATYTINEQQIIPSAAVTVFAQSNTALATVNAATAIQHGEMTFDATTDSAVLFTADTIYLNNAAHVANTNSEQVFNVNGTVQFDSAVVVAGTSDSGTTISNVRTTSASVSSGMSVNGEELNIAGGDLAYTLNVSGSDTVISGVSAPATISGELANNAQILTESTGTYQVGTDTFTITGDSAVAFKTESGAVTAIDSLAGTATGNFDGINVNSKSVNIYNDIDSVQAVTADGENITEITGVGNANTDVVVANAGGATLVSTNYNGGIYFGAPGSTISSKHYTVNDADSVVSFLTSGLDDYTPSVSGVNGLEEGNIAISQAESNFAVNSQTVNLTDVSSDVTLNVADSAIVSVNGLTGGISGLASGVAVEITDSNATVNGSQVSIYEPNGTNVIYTSTVSDTVTTNVITGLNNNAAVYVAANMNILTDEAGTFTFNNGVYTISGDDNVTFETDGNSNVKNVANVVGTVQSSANNNTINGAAVSSNDTDVTIVAAGSGVSSVLGAKDGDSISVPAGTAVEVAGNSDPTVTSAFAVNGKAFEVTGDTDTVAFTAGTPDSISGLAPGASLRAVNTAGIYNVNGSEVYASVGAVIIGDEEGTAHVYDPSDVNISSDDTPEQVIEKVTGSTSSTAEGKYVENMDSETAQAALTAGGSALDGNLEMELGGGTGTSSTDSVETADFSGSKGIKKAKMNGEGNQNVKFNDEGGNIAVVGDDAEGTKNVSLGNGGDLAVVGKTKASTPVNIKTGRGQDSVISQGRNVAVDVSAGGPTRLMANGYGASMEVSGYDANTGAGIQLTNSDIKAAVKKNTVALENGKVTTSEGAEIRTNADTAEGSSVVNFYNLKGLMTKVGYTHNEGGTVDLSGSKNDVVMKGNYTEGNAQRKSGSSKLISGSGDDYALGGAGDDIDVGAGNNTIELDGTTRTNADAGAVISQTATSGRTEVTGFNNEFGDTGDRVNISTSANVRFANGVLTFLLGAAQLILNGMTASGGSSSDLAESADEDDNATAVTGSTDYARVMIGDATAAVKTAVASEGNWIGGSDSLWTEDNMPSAYVGQNSGVSFLNSDGALDMTLGSGSDGNGAGTLGGQEISVRGISKVRLGNGPSTLYGAATTNNTIVTGLGDGSVWGGGASNDTFIGRQTSLKSGESTFFYVDGDGKDTISNFEFLTGENANTADIVNVLGTSITGASTSGNDVIVNLARSEDDRLTIKDAAGKDFIMEYGNVGNFDTLVAQVNGTSLTLDGRATYYQATGRNATLTADSGLNSAEVWLNNDRNFSQNTFVGDISVLNASGVQGASTLVGNNYNNSIVGSSENSSMWGGNSHEANDTLIGGAGADMFWYGKNEGNDVISGADENDVINLYNVNIADVESYDNWNITNNSISFNLKDGGSLTIQSNNSGVGFRFADDGNTYAINQRTKEYYTK